jgi:hypothetical protein
MLPFFPGALSLVLAEWECDQDCHGPSPQEDGRQQKTHLQMTTIQGLIGMLEGSLECYDWGHVT